MNILVAVNRNYISKLKVLIESIRFNNKVKLDVFLFHSELLDEDIDELNQFISKNNRSELHAIRVDAKIFSGINIDIPGLSIETYYRLMASELLPSNIDRILYLDVDIIVDGSLYEFYNIDFEDKVAVVCEDTIASFRDDIRTRIGLSKEGKYFNAGVILFNMNKWRETISYKEIKQILLSGVKYPFHDQDILNILLDGKLKYISPFIYNFEIVLGRDYIDYYIKNVEKSDIKPIIYHYAGDINAKPWNTSFNCGDFNKYYWKYAGSFLEESKNSTESDTIKALRNEIELKEYRISKFKSYFNLLNVWKSIENKNKNIDSFFEFNRIKKIAIYGFGELGKRLYDDIMRRNSLEIVYAIDKKKINNTFIDVKTMEDELPEVDAIIVSAIMDFEEICKVLEKKVSCPIISLDEVISYADGNVQTYLDVIVPLYNGKKFLSSIVNMLEKNAIKADNIAITLIIVNDYPEEVIDKECIKSNKISILIVNHEKNLGIHQTRIDGLNMATGEYVLFLDQDDEISDDYFSSQLEKIGHADAIVCNGNIIDKRQNIKTVIYPTWCNINKCISEWTNLICDNRIISTGQVLIRRGGIPEVWKKSILKKNGIDDYLLWIIMLEKSCKFEVNDNCIFSHIMTGNNTSSNNAKTIEAMEEMLEVVNKSRDIFCNDEFKEMFLKTYKYHILERTYNYDLPEELTKQNVLERIIVEREREEQYII